MSITIKSGDSQARASVTDEGELKTFTRLDTTGASSLPVRSAQMPVTTQNFAPGETGSTDPINVEFAGNCTFYVKNTVAGLPFGGNPVIRFEQSDDAVSWAALPVVRSDTNVIRAVRTLAPNTAYNELVFDAETEGARYVRARVLTACNTSSMTICVIPGALPFTPFVSIGQPERRSVLISNTNMPVGANNVEQVLTLNRCVGGREFDTTQSFVIPAGRTYVMQNLTLSQIGNGSGTGSAVTTFKLRFSSIAPVTTTSPITFQARLGTINESGDYAVLSIPLSEGIYIEGDGKACFGISAVCAYGSPPTIDVAMVGYEY